MYCMKALGVNHFKGNCTNKKKIPSTLPSSWLFQVRNTPSDPHSSQSSAMDKPVYILCHNKKRMDTWKCVFLSVRKGDVVIWAVLLLGWSTLGVSLNDILRRQLRRDHMAQNGSVLHWKYTRLTVSIFSRTRTSDVSLLLCLQCKASEKR